MLEKILEYQATELELMNLENEISKSKDRERATEIQQSLKNQHAKLVSLEGEAKKVNDSYQKATKKYEEYMKKLEALENEIKNADPEKVEQYSKLYKDFASVGVALEKDIQTIYANVQQISKAYEDIILKSKTDREKFDKFKELMNRREANPYKVKLERRDAVKWLILIALLCFLMGMLTPIGDEPYTHIFKLMSGTTTKNFGS